MYSRQRLAVLVFVGIFLVPAALLWHCAEQAADGVAGRVINAAGPVGGARVRWQGEPSFVVSDANGRFRLAAPRGTTRNVTASLAGYRIASAHTSEVFRDFGSLDLRLEPLPAEDNEDYRWLSPHPDAGGSSNCANCHDAIYREWRAGAHARSARNPHLLQLIADPDGKSPPGWDLSREHPLGTGVCATCHAPTFDGDELQHARGVAADGVHCDYCHKIADAPTDKLGTRFGRDGLAMLRPGNGDLLFYGPLTDSVRRGESFAQMPVYQESRLCASCHEGILFGVHVYGTYSEWLQSPARQQGKQCQSCHMTPTGQMMNIAPGHGGVQRDPHTLASHRFPGGQADMLRRCLDTDVQFQGARALVTVRADNVGHRVPTGFIDRHLLLVVQAFDPSNTPIPLVSGPRLPAAAGTWAGAAGRLYGKLLHNNGGDGPHPFWVPGLEIADTRLRPAEPDCHTYVFAARPARLKIQLWYRRFWQTIADARGWRDNDMLVLSKTLSP